MDQGQSMQARLMIPHNKYFQAILDAYQTDAPQYDQYLNGYEQQDYLINGQLIPIFIVFESSDNELQIKERFPENLQTQFNFQQQESILHTYSSFLLHNLQINLGNHVDKLSYQLTPNKLIICKILPFCVQQQFIDNEIQINAQIISTNDQPEGPPKLDDFITYILQNAIDSVKISKVGWDVHIRRKVVSAVTSNLQCTSNTSKASLIFKFTIHPDISLNSVEWQLQESKVQWKDTNFIRDAPREVLQYLRVSKQYFKDAEGFVEIQIDWPAMLDASNNGNVQLPSRRMSIATQLVNPSLQVLSPLYLIWNQKGYDITTLQKIEFNWNVKAVNQLGAQISEVLRYTQDQQEYLALKIQVINYSTMIHKLIFNPPPQVFGKKLKQNKSQEPLIVLGITMSSQLDMGYIEPCQKKEAVLRVQLINRGILNIQELSFTIGDKETNIHVNFLHSYQ